MKVVFFGTSSVGIPTLKALTQEYEVTAVVTAPDAPFGRKQILTPSPIAQLATELNLNTLKPTQVKTNHEFLQELQNLAADIFIVVSYGKILPKAVIDLPRLKTLNIHFSALPKYRGAAPIQFALLHGKTQTATTIFILDELLDHGPILAQEPTTIKPNDTFTTLSERMAEQSAQLLLRILPDYAAGKLKAQEQNHSEATYTKILTKQDGRINWHKSAQDIYNQWRALTLWPGVWTTWNDKILKILECEPSSESNNVSQPGTVLPDGTISCAHGQLKVIKLQLEGKSPLTIAEFLRGNKAFIGSSLN
jgi:methionyl-tRNA formyltransferase